MVNTRKTMNDMVPTRSIRNISKDDIAPSSTRNLGAGASASIKARKTVGKADLDSTVARRGAKTTRTKTVPAPVIKRSALKTIKSTKEDKTSKNLIEQNEISEHVDDYDSDNENTINNTESIDSSIFPKAVTTPLKVRGGSIYKDMTPVEMYSAPITKIDQDKEGAYSSIANQGKSIKQRTVEPESNYDSTTYNSSAPKKNRKISLWVIITGSICIILTILLVILTNLSSAKIAITPKHAEYSVDTIITSKIKPSSTIELPYSYISVYTVSSTTVAGVPGDFIQKKARGSVMIFNNNTSSQALVAGTRLQSKKGLIYKLTSNVTIPAKKGTGAQAVPGSVVAEIVADQPGDIYNLLVSELNGEFSIPGFKGTPRAGLVYGRQKSDITGGSVGRELVIDAKTASSTDIVLRANAEKTLKEALLGSIPDSYTAYENMISINTGPLVKSTVNTQTNQKSEINKGSESNEKTNIADQNLLRVSIEGRAVLPIFKTQSLIEKILAKDSNKYPFGVYSVENISSLTPTIISNPLTATSISFAGSVVNKVNININVASSTPVLTGSSKVAKLEKEKIEKPLVFKVKDNLLLKGIVPLDKVKEKLLGSPASSSNTVFINFPGISSADISIIPFWVHSFPTDPSRLKVEIKK